MHEVNVRRTRYGKVEVIVSVPAELDLVPSNTANAKTVRIEADATRRTALEKIFNFIMYFNNLESLIIDDDYIRLHDPDTIHFLKRLKEEKPELSIKWTYALKIDGQHGR